MHSLAYIVMHELANVWIISKIVKFLLRILHFRIFCKYIHFLSLTWRENLSHLSLLRWVSRRVALFVAFLSLLSNAFCSYSYQLSVIRVVQVCLFPFLPAFLRTCNLVVTHLAFPPAGLDSKKKVMAHERPLKKDFSLGPDNYTFTSSNHVHLDVTSRWSYEYAPISVIHTIVIK